MSNYKNFFLSQPHWNKSATLTSGLENIYKDILFKFPQESFHDIQT